MQDIDDYLLKILSQSNLKSSFFFFQLLSVPYKSEHSYFFFLQSESLVWLLSLINLFFSLLIFSNEVRQVWGRCFAIKISLVLFLFFLSANIADL